MVLGSTVRRSPEAGGATAEPWSGLGEHPAPRAMIDRALIDRALINRAIVDRALGRKIAPKGLLWRRMDVSPPGFIFAIARF